ncbi:hypothetical protein BBW65_02240 [Helicobacter enhydrae]|uniref:Guanidinium exporter n=1 Tax=Helicobacter enhydrae TaxID=222136 RepID=A0A1B1U4S6_9HELI|nr:multidrug efflux SMR transporter [Helicobacter enhydrae]ANV97695.1 hypothetical protein BBW65_02240 [Helicobacter enhydrae]
MSWFALVLAGCFEVAGVFVMKKLSYAKGVRLVLLYVAMSVTFGISLAFLGFAMRKIDMSVAYAIWTGIGAVGGVIMGALIFKETLSLAKCFCLFLIIASVVGLKLLD